MRMCAKQVKTISVLRFGYEYGTVSEIGHKYSYKEYNEAGKVLQSIQYDADGEIQSKSLFSYDDKQNLILERRYDHQGVQISRFTFSYKYDDEGRIQEILQYDQDDLERKVIYQYNPDGTMTETIFIGNVLSETKSYNQQGLLFNDYHAGTNIDTFYLYDDRRNLISVRETHQEGHVEHIFENQYDDSVNLTSVKRNGVLEATYHYDTAGNLIEEVHYDFESKPREMLKYEYEFYS